MSHPVPSPTGQSEHEILILLSSYPGSQRKDSIREQMKEVHGSFHRAHAFSPPGPPGKGNREVCSSVPSSGQPVASFLPVSYPQGSANGVRPPNGRKDLVQLFLLARHFPVCFASPWCTLGMRLGVAAVELEGAGTGVRQRVGMR
eukprot:2107593-Pyramimonas_sp.AAC.1